MLYTSLLPEIHPINNIENTQKIQKNSTIKWNMHFLVFNLDKQKWTKEQKSAFQMDVAPWCYKWIDWEGMDLWVGWGIEHLTVLISIHEITFDKDMDKMLKQINMCYIFEMQGVQGIKIWKSD